MLSAASAPTPPPPFSLIDGPRVDVIAFARELAEATPIPLWVDHFNSGAHSGDWSGMALRSTSGRGDDIRPDSQPEQSFVDTPLLQSLPSLRATFANTPWKVRGARLLRLAPGGRIGLHSDDDLAPGSGECRLHCPLTAGDAVDFRVNGERVPFGSVGQWWYVDVSLPHRVVNWGDTPRIHLVIDIVVDADFFVRVSAANEVVLADDFACSFEAFRSLMITDSDVFAVLSAPNDLDLFAARAIALGAARGFRFTERDVRDAAQLGKQQWSQRRLR